MKPRLMLVLFSIVCLLFTLFTPHRIQAAIADLPKPITGTFYVIDYNTSDPNFTAAKLNDYFAEMRREGIDTVIFSNGPGHIDCSADGLAWDFLGDGVYANMLGAAASQNMSVYLSLPSWDACRDPINNSTHRTIYINQAMDLYVRVFALIQTNGWNSNLIAGIYLPETSLSWIDPYVPLYREFSAAFVSRYPGKHVLISPYKYSGFYDSNPGCINGCTDSPQLLKDKVKNLIKTTNVDIIAPQDSVGTFKVNYPLANKLQNEAIAQAVTEANAESGKTAQAWINIESFRCTDWHCVISGIFPASFNQVRWQILTAYQIPGISKLITFIHQWDLTTALLFDNLYSTTGQYAPERKILRQTLKNNYLNKPIIVAAFPWATGGVNYFILKGFNFGPVGSTVSIYAHYNNNSKNANFTGQVAATGDAGKIYYEIRVALGSLPGFVSTQSFDIALVNTAGQVSYFRSQLPATFNPADLTDPAFPEIPAGSPTPTATRTPTPSPTPVTYQCSRCSTTNGCEWTQFSSYEQSCINPIATTIVRTLNCTCPEVGGASRCGSCPASTPTPTPTIPAKPGDGNGDNRVDGADYVIWLGHYGITNPAGSVDGDFNNDHRVDGQDYVVWLGNYGR